MIQVGPSFIQTARPHRQLRPPLSRRHPQGEGGKRTLGRNGISRLLQRVSRVMPYRMGEATARGFLALMTNEQAEHPNNLVFTGTRACGSPFEQWRIVASKAADTAGGRSRRSRIMTTSPSSPFSNEEVDLPYRKPAKEKSFSRKCSRKAPRKETISTAGPPR